jgi:mannitol/fructose-specific phosphotransferase system IIA component (Ntr-type)
LNRLKNIDYRLKQKLLYTDKTCPEILKKCGDLLREQGRISDALDFYQKADDREGLQKIKDMALESGDVMLFQQAAKGLGIELKPKDWEDIAQKAVQLKKHSFAQQALQKANHEKGLNAPKQH